MTRIFAFSLLVTLVTSARADVFNMPSGQTSITMVPVGNPGNLPDSATGNLYGSVGYNYSIDAYDVTLGQYTAFLNAVAQTDPYACYTIYMQGGIGTGYPFGIARTGSPGSYSYSVAGSNPQAANMPVFGETWGDAARFCNWLDNGQPNTGVENLTTTESGAYYLNGGTTSAQLMAVASPAHSGGSAAKYFLPAEDEWYKAAYFSPLLNGGSGGYWKYATQCNTAPDNSLALANSESNDANILINYHVSDPTNFLTPVGTYTQSPSYYGTFDQSGDIEQWNEALANGVNGPNSWRGARGGFWYDNAMGVASSDHGGLDPASASSFCGFRIAGSVAVPEPGSIGLLLVGAGGLLIWRLRRREIARILMVMLAVVIVATSARANVFNLGGTQNPDGSWNGLASLQFVPVGNPGNVADTTTFGAVGYNYNIGKYDVTVAQYTAFLNAVAKTDTYGLYISDMALISHSTEGISRTGSPGSYSYAVTGSNPQAANCPIFDVTWGDAARFCNWLQNGQPTGAEGNRTTEAGAYTLSGDTSSLLETRNAGATYFIPTGNEWYKACYFDPSLNGGAGGYWRYPTKSNTAPINTLPDTGNHANFYDIYGTGNHGYTDPTNYLTPVGDFVLSPSAYGTYDQGGDVWQWNEAILFGWQRGLLGGSYDCYTDYLFAPECYYTSATAYDVGFRVASSEAVPEPGSITIALGVAVVAGLWCWRRR